MKVLQCSIFKITEKLYTQFFQFCVLLHKRYSDVSNKRGEVIEGVFMLANFQ